MRRLPPRQYERISDNMMMNTAKNTGKDTVKTTENTIETKTENTIETATETSTEMNTETTAETITEKNTVKTADEKTEKTTSKVENDFRILADELENNDKIKKMKEFIQHGKINTYDHCKSVARTSYKIAKGLHLSVNEKELVKGAFLHDYFLYDWHHHDGHWHGLTHPETAKQNAERDFELTEKEKNIIESHMWPLTPLALPKSKEAVLVCIADKFCSLKETLFHR